MKLTFLEEIPVLKRIFWCENDRDTLLNLEIMSWHSMMEREDKLTMYVALFNMCATYNWTKTQCKKFILPSDKDKKILEHMLEFVYRQLEGENTSPERIKQFTLPIDEKEPQVIKVYRFVVALWEYLNDCEDTSLRIKAIKHFKQLDANHQNYILFDRIYDYDFYLPKIVPGGPFFNGSNFISSEFKQTPLGKMSMLNLQILAKCDSKLLDEKINEIAYDSVEFQRVDDLSWAQNLLRRWKTKYIQSGQLLQENKSNTLFMMALKEGEFWSQTHAHVSTITLDACMHGCLEKGEDLPVEYIRYIIISELYRHFEKKYRGEYDIVNMVSDKAMAVRIYKPLKGIRNVMTHSKKEEIDDSLLFRLLFSIGLRYIHDSSKKEEQEDLYPEEIELIKQLIENWGAERSFEQEGKQILWRWYKQLMSASDSKRNKLVSTDLLMRGLSEMSKAAKGTKEISCYNYEWMIKWLCIKFAHARVEDLDFNSNTSEPKFIASFDLKKDSCANPALFELAIAYMKHELCKKEKNNESLTVYL